MSKIVKRKQKIDTRTMKPKYCSWSYGEFLKRNIGSKLCEWERLSQLFASGNSVPFIARYRQEITKELDVDDLHCAQQLFEKAKNIDVKVGKLFAELKEENRLTEELQLALKEADCDEDIAVIKNAVSLKSKSKSTLAQQAESAGLMPFAMSIIQGSSNVNCESLVDPTVAGRVDLNCVMKGLESLITEYIWKDQAIRKFCDELSLKTTAISVTVSKSRNAVKSETESDIEKVRKYKNYFGFTKRLISMKAYQVLAINRGENDRVLSKTITLPLQFRSQFQQLCASGVLRRIACRYQPMATKCFDQCYKRHITPFIIRLVWRRAVVFSKQRALKVFMRNYRQLLLSPPLKDCMILGIDPGFQKGCKYAFISASGSLLSTGIFFLPEVRPPEGQPDSLRELIKFVIKSGCAKIGIGNGSGCRETERLISTLINQGAFLPVDVQYCIVSEAGTSQFSVSAQAIAEFPDLDPCLRSAVSIARRLQDPLSEYVRADPASVGVGMYQHDIPQKQLHDAVRSVAQECVSFVGVDLNTCSETILSHVAGLNKDNAKEIIKYRKKHGPFVCRDQLREVRRIGPVTFEQAAGFLRIFCGCQSESYNPKSTRTLSISSRKREASGIAGPQNKNRKRQRMNDYQPNVFDRTAVHPESYGLAEKVLAHLGLSKEEMFTHACRQKLALFTAQKEQQEQLAQRFSVPVETIRMVTTALNVSAQYDMRDDFAKPIFKQNILSIDDVKINEMLSGTVRTVADFGAFVDVGLEHDGLVPASKLADIELMVGQRVSVVVCAIDPESRKFTLALANPDQDVPCVPRIY